MTLSLYPSLSAGLNSLAGRYRSVRASQPLPAHADVEWEDLPQVPGGFDQLRQDVQSIWDTAITSTAEGVDEEIVRAEVELTGRQLVLDTAYEEPTSSCASQEKILFLLSLSDALDIALTLFEIALSSPILNPSDQLTASFTKDGLNPVSAAQDAGTIFVPILEELVDLLSIESWAGIFGYLESRSHRFTANLLPSKGKSLPLLKLLNTLLRSIPKTSSKTSSSTSSSSQSQLHPHSNQTNLELRARIHIFASQTFAISDPSGVNLRGEYWVEDWRKLREREIEGEKGKRLVEGKGEGQGQEGQEGDARDVKMDVNEDGKMEGSEEGEQTYSEGLDQHSKLVCASLQSLQPFFSNPPSIMPSTPHASSLLNTLTEIGFPLNDKDTPLGTFKRIVGIVLKAFGEVGKMKAGAVGGGEQEEEGGYPHYLSSPELMQSQLQSLSFRRQILVQLLIFLQIIRNQDAREKPKLPKDTQFPTAFTTSVEDVEWARERTIEVKDMLAADGDGGKEFNGMISTVLNRETHYATWKHLSCRPFEKPSAPEADILLADRQRKVFLAPLKPYKFPVGTAALTAMHRDPLTSVEQLMNFEIPSTVESLKAEYDQQVEEEADATAMGQTDENRLGPWLEEKASLSWRALRLVVHNDLGIFSEIGATGDLATLTKALEKRKDSAADGGAGGVAMSRGASGESASGQGKSPAPVSVAETMDVKLSESSALDVPEEAVKQESPEKQDATATESEDVKMEVDEIAADKVPDQGDVVME